MRISSVLDRGEPISFAGRSIVPVSRHVTVTLGGRTSWVECSYAGAAAIEVDGVAIRVVDWQVVLRLAAAGVVMWQVFRGGAT